MPRRLHRVPLHVRPPDEPIHVLVVLHQGSGLHRIARHERVAREGVARLAAEVHEAWRGRQDDVEAGAAVVVVREATLGQRVRVARVEAGPESSAELLVEIEAQRLALEARVRNDAAVILHRPGGEVLRVVRAPRNARRRLERKRLEAGQLLLEVKERARPARQVAQAPDERTCRRVPRNPRRKGTERVGRVLEHARSDLVRQLEETHALRDVELGSAYPAPLRLDDDHPV